MDICKKSKYMIVDSLLLALLTLFKIRLTQFRRCKPHRVYYRSTVVTVNLCYRSSNLPFIETSGIIVMW